MLEKLYQAIMQSVAKDRRLEICERTLGAPGGLLEQYAADALGLRELTLTEVQCAVPEINALRLTGKLALSDTSADAAFCFCERLQLLYADLRLDYPDPAVIDLFPGQKLQGRGLVKQFVFPLTQKAEYDLFAQAVVTEPMTYSALIWLLLDGLTCSSNLRQDPLLEELQIEYRRQQRLHITQRSVSVRSQGLLRASESIAVGALGFRVTRSGTFYDLALSGEIQIKQKCLPVMLFYGDEAFTLGLGMSSEKADQLALSDIAALVGLDLSSSLPEYFSVLTNLRLTQLLVRVASDFSRVNSAQVGISSAERWEFLGLKGLSLREICLDVSADFLTNDSSVEAQISGLLAVGGFDIALTASRDRDGFTFSGAMPTDEQMDFRDLIRELAGLLEVSMDELPIPAITLQNTCVGVSTSQALGELFHLETFVQVQVDDSGEIVHRLLNIEATIVVDSVKKDGKRSFSGCFTGELDIAGQTFTVVYRFGPDQCGQITAGWKMERTAGLGLVDILEYFGAVGLPELVRELDPKLSSVELCYSFTGRQLSCTVVSPLYGTFVVFLWPDASGRMQYALTFTVNQRIGLDSLPVVGTDLHLLDGVGVTGLTLQAASADLGPQTAGVLLGGAVAVGKSSVPFALELVPKAGCTDAAEGTSKWFTVEKNLGIFNFHRVAITYRDGAAGFLLDAGLSADPLGIELMGVGMGLPLVNPAQPVFFLSGLKLSCQTSSLSLSGSFCNAGAGRYDGELTVKAAAFELFALGSYQNGSLFAYALLGSALGGPPAFFVTGLAFGFGYHRDLLLPPIERVRDFPLVQGALGRLNRSAMIAEMEKVVPVSSSQSFLAAGVKFTSFRMAESFALCTVAFGSRLEIALLGLSEISVPAHVGGNPIAYAQLSLRAVCAPDDGIFSVQAQLTGESFLLSRACKLTGGFAFFLWFDGAHKGDFVITLGGYHRDYTPPAHYPAVPRLGFSWKITSGLSLSGELYFALTPRCLMAGGSLDAVYQSGGLRAWFCARADFLISWKPFHYDCSLYIGVGASYRMNLLFCHVTLHVELSASLHLWGPEFSGTARITWFIISFTISFGNASQKPALLDWNEFALTFLPRASDEGNDSEALEPLSLSLEGVLNRTETGEEIVDPDALKILLHTAVPFQRVCCNMDKPLTNSTPLGVLPMGENRVLDASCTVRVCGQDNTPVAMQVSPLTERIPSALWGLRDGGLNGEGLLDGAWTGAALTPVPPQGYPSLPPDRFLDIRELSITVCREFSWNTPLKPSGPTYPQTDCLAVFRKTAMSTETTHNRCALIDQFAALGYTFAQKIDLKKLAAQSSELFVEEIQLQSLL